MMNGRLVFPFILLILCLETGWCQETVFSLLKTETRRADEYYANKNYRTALDLYENIYRKRSSSENLILKIARCHYFLKEYGQAVAEYEVEKKIELTQDDLYYYAESLSCTGNYSKAIDAYRQYVKQAPENNIAMQKIWRISNLSYLYEDSVHYAVRSISLNTSNGEFSPVPFQDGLIYISNSREVQLIEKIDATMNAPFYKMYFASRTPADSIPNGVYRYGKPIPFNRHLTGLHTGPIALYAKGNKMVITSTGQGPGGGISGKTLQLFFAEKENSQWKITNAFPYNSHQYSLSDPSINQEGTLLFFSSDMKGGAGGKDLYRSMFINGQWSNPENLGEMINTERDEVSPFMHTGNEFYFSSNGHPGLGGLDIFKSQLIGANFDEVLNVGYPINSSGDEFDIILDSIGAHGYFSSNRKNSGYDDDIYEFDIDLQPYPLEIGGLIHFKEHSWSDSSELKPFMNARLFLIDILKEGTVTETVSDTEGNFVLTIPYFSKYKIRVLGPEKDEHIVSFEIPRYRNTHSVKHEIVIVKDIFQLPENKSTR